MKNFPSKYQVIRSLSSSRRKILNLIEPLPESKWNKIFLGKWCLKDLVAHLIGWDFWGTKATKEILKGKLPSYYKYHDNGWNKFNDKLVKDFKKGGKKELLKAVKKSHIKLVQELKHVPQYLYHADFGISWKRQKVTLYTDTIWQANDELTHVKQIQSWLTTGELQ